jgi:hypothetical protein
MRQQGVRETGGRFPPVRDWRGHYRSLIRILALSNYEVIRGEAMLLFTFMWSPYGIAMRFASVHGFMHNISEGSRCRSPSLRANGALAGLRER